MDAVKRVKLSRNPCTCKGLGKSFRLIDRCAIIVLAVKKQCF